MTASVTKLGSDRSNKYSPSLKKSTLHSGQYRSPL